MNNENCEPRIRFTAQRGRQGFELILPRLHVFLAHTHPGGVGGERLYTPLRPTACGAGESHEVARGGFAEGTKSNCKWLTGKW